MPPIKRPITTKGFDKSKLTEIFSRADPSNLEKYLMSSVYAAKRTKAPKPADPIA